MGEQDEPVTIDRALTTGDQRADDSLLLVERLRELRRRRRMGELTDEQLSAERLRLLERRSRTAQWHGPERRVSGPVESAAPEDDGSDPFEALRRMAATVGQSGRRHRAATLLDALERTLSEGYQEVNGVTLSRRAARFAERELDARDQS